MRLFATVLGTTLLAMVAALLLWRIWPLLPQRGGGEACFAAGYDPSRPLHLMSRHPDRQSMGAVKSMSARILLPAEEQPYRDERSGRSYDWRYSLRLRVELADGDRLSTASICEWSNTFGERMIRLCWNAISSARAAVSASGGGSDAAPFPCGLRRRSI